MSTDSGKSKQDKTKKKSASKAAEEQPQERLQRLSSIANTTDYWRTEPSALLFFGLARVDPFVRETASGLSKVLTAWDAMLDKVRELRSSPKVKNAMDNLSRLSSFRNPWRLLTMLLSFLAIAVIFIGMVLFPTLYIIIVPLAFVFVFGLQFYGSRKLNRSIRSNIETMQKSGAPQLEELSDLCRDLTQSIISALRFELPKLGRSSDTFTLRLLSNDYSGVKLRVEEKVKKKSRRNGDLYSIVWK